jgi:hypothetical protein
MVPSLNRNVYEVTGAGKPVELATKVTDSCEDGGSIDSSARGVAATAAAGTVHTILMAHITAMTAALHLSRGNLI